MTQSRVIGITSLLLATALSVPAWGQDSTPQRPDSARPENVKANPARPGSLNYVEGQASIERQSLGPEAIGRTELQPGQSLETLAGKAELLLTPGAFFRLGDNSSVTMISPTLTDTELRLDKGEATVEVAELHPENNLVIAEDGAKIRLIQTGFYDFDADNNLVRVYEGEAQVEMNGQDLTVESGHQIVFNAGAMKTEKFNKDQIQDDLYRWSSLRSSYLAEANSDQAQDYQAGTYGGGWDWDPYYGAYTFVPGDGVFYSPFGWGFYSPFDVGFAPIFFFGHREHDFDRDFRHFRDGDHGDREHFADRGHDGRDGRDHFGDRGHDGHNGGDHVADRGHGGDAGHHESHYYDHFDHGSYRGPGHSEHSGFNGTGVVAAGGHMGFHGGEGFHGGPGSAGFHGGGGAIGSHGMGGVGAGMGPVGGVHGGGGVPGGAGHVGGGFHGGGAPGGGHVGGGAPSGGGFHGGGGGGGHAGGGGGGGGHH
jgi:FecR protein